MKLVRRITLAILLALSAVPAFGQAPAPVPALPDTERRTSYSLTSSTCACTVNFALYGDSTDYQNWVEVWLSGVMVQYNDPTYGWTLTSPSGTIGRLPLPITDAIVTFNKPQTGTVQIVGARRPRRVSQFSENRGVAARDLNQALTDIVAQNRETWDKINDVTGRVPRAPPGELLAMFPPASQRANMGVCFDGSGNMVPCIGPSTGTFSAGSGINFTGTNPTVVSAITVPPLRPASPGNLYVSVTGSDSNSCLSVGAACATLQHAINLATTYDLQGSPIIINLGAGTFTQGGLIDGSLVGATGTGGLAPSIEIIGAGSANTTLDPSSTCAGIGNALYISDGIAVGIGSLRIQSTCPGASAFSINNRAIGYLVDSDVVFGTSNFALISVFYAKFDANYGGSKPFNFAGSAQFGMWISSQAEVATGIGVTNTIIGTPNYSIAFVEGIDHSFYSQGINSTWSNAANATGTRYSFALLSVADTEQNTNNLPGNAPGLLQAGSYYYDNRNSACVGGATGCRATTAPAGLGTGGTAIMAVGSSDHSGAVQLSAGTGASSSGTLVVATGSILSGDWGGGGFCSVSLNNNASSWAAGANVQGFYNSGLLSLSWNNNGSALGASSAYRINYVCG